MFAHNYHFITGKAHLTPGAAWPSVSGGAKGETIPINPTIHHLGPNPIKSWNVFLEDLQVQASHLLFRS